MPAGEIHLQLAVNFPGSRKVRALVRYGRDVRALRDLYVQMCLYSKGNLTDGFVPDEEIGVLVYPDAEKSGQRDAGRLIEVGLIERAAGGYFITGWFDRNPSRDDVRQKSAAKARGARLANHRRWHIEHGNPDPRCEWCQSEDQNTDQTTDPNSDQTSGQSVESDRVDPVKRSDSTESESKSESDTESKERPPGRQRPAVSQKAIGSDEDPDFVAFWSAYPRRDAKGQARTAWRTAVITKRTDPKIVILAAERFADRERAIGTERRFIAHPATWLNGERWLEYGEDAQGDDGSDDDDFWTG